MPSPSHSVPPSTLADTIDQVNEAAFYGQKISAVRRRTFAALIANRLGLPGGYAGTFAETAAERATLARTFTGENLGDNARRRHVLAEEAGRVLHLLGGPTACAAAALAEADRRLLTQIKCVRARHPQTPRGTYCCPFCTVSVWRHVAAGGLRAFAPELPAGLRHLRADRATAGGWRRYPFFYTLSTLLELDTPGARAELRHVAPRCARLLAALRAAPRYATRRREILQRVLART